MKEFFAGWRTKIGIVTLLMACLMMAGWVRSSGFEDVAAFPLGGAALAGVSLDGLLICGFVSDVTPGSLPPYPMWQARPYCSLEHFIARKSLLIDWQINGFGVGQMYSVSPFKVWIVPYWSTTIPLTLISLWLLLPKLRKSTPKKAPEPIPAGET